MTTITLELPESVFPALRCSAAEFAKELRLAAAIHWYTQGEVSQEIAAEIAGLHRVEFLEILARKKIDVFHVDMDEVERETGIATLSSKLDKLAAERRAPQSWFDAKDDPTQPENG